MQIHVFYYFTLAEQLENAGEISVKFRLVPSYEFIDDTLRCYVCSLLYRVDCVCFRRICEASRPTVK